MCLPMNLMSCSQILSIFVLTVMSMSTQEADILQPYKTHHGPIHRRLHDTKKCQHRRYDNTTYSLHKAHVNQSDFDHVVDAYHKLADIGEFYYSQRHIDLRFQMVHNPERTFSVLEPGHRGSCEETDNVRATVQETARDGNCIVAANAGFFNTHTGQCLGNIVSDGRLVQDSGGIQNVHFGITKQGQLFTGYLSEIELVTLQFKQLVGGVVWLLRDGQVYVDESRDIECPDTEETGTLDRFIGVVSARTAVGHDSEGRVLMVQVDGKTDKQGVDLHEFANILKDLGFVNAVNLDGGGSATSVINGTLVNYPSDSCVNSTWNCARAVSTILCAHPAVCWPRADCSHHGQCVSGHCHCRPPWSGQSCERLSCPNHCNRHGQCLEDGCLCKAGWRGQDCSVPCGDGTYGANCSRVCQCVNNSTCDPVSGVCWCPSGFTGKHCASVCDYGWYGEGCRYRCSCPDQCVCHHITGACSNTSLDGNFYKVSQCLIAAAIRQDNLVPDQSDQIMMWKLIALIAGIIAVICIGISITLAIIVHRKQRRSKKRRFRYPFKHYKHKSVSRTEITELLPLHGSKEQSSFTDSSDEADEETTFFQKKIPLEQTSGER